MDSSNSNIFIITRYAIAIVAQLYNRLISVERHTCTTLSIPESILLPGLKEPRSSVLDL